MGMKCRICVEVLENGYEVELPDVDAMNKAEAAAKKKPGSPMPYMGDFMKSYAAKTVAEVLNLVKPALSNLPQVQYDAAFEAAAEEAD